MLSFADPQAVGSTGLVPDLAEAGVYHERNGPFPLLNDQLQW